jgi:putative addiction module component (TIGR02574 family)
MTSDVESLLVAALRLPADARATLAAALIESLDPDESAEGVEEAWAEEIQRRLEEVDAEAASGSCPRTTPGSLR